MVNSDAVVRNVYHKYFHPKEAFINNGVLNRALLECAGKRVICEALFLNSGRRQ